MKASHIIRTIAAIVISLATLHARSQELTFVTGPGKGGYSHCYNAHRLLHCASVLDITALMTKTDKYEPYRLLSTKSVKSYNGKKVDWVEVMYGYYVPIDKDRQVKPIHHDEWRAQAVIIYFDLEARQVLTLTYIFYHPQRLHSWDEYCKSAGFGVEREEAAENGILSHLASPTYDYDIALYEQSGGLSSVVFRQKGSLVDPH